MKSLPVRWFSMALLAVLGSTHCERRPVRSVVEEPSTAPAKVDANDGAACTATAPAADTSPCAHLRDRLAYLPASAAEPCDTTRCRSAGGECAPAGRVCPSACVRRSRDSSKACTAREDCEGQCLAPAGA